MRTRKIWRYRKPEFFYRIPGFSCQFTVCFCLFFFQSRSRIDLSAADESRMTAVQVGTVRWHNHLAHEGESVVTKFFLGQLRYYYVRRTDKVISYHLSLIRLLIGFCFC